MFWSRAFDRQACDTRVLWPVQVLSGVLHVTTQYFIFPRWIDGDDCNYNNDDDDNDDSELPHADTGDSEAPINNLRREPPSYVLAPQSVVRACERAQVCGIPLRSSTQLAAPLRNWERERERERQMDSYLHAVAYLTVGPGDHCRHYHKPDEC